jgi:hypothetical protein
VKHQTLNRVVFCLTSGDTSRKIPEEMTYQSNLRSLCAIAGLPKAAFGYVID